MKVLTASQYYIFEMARIMELNDFRLPYELIHTLESDLEYIRCCVCSGSRFRRVPSFLVFRICIQCKALLLRSVMRFYLRRIEFGQNAELKAKMQAELLDRCHHPDYILKTGLIETEHLFLQ